MSEKEIDKIHYKMNNLKRIFFLLIMVFGASLQAQQIPLTLQQLIDRALEADPNLVMLEHKRDASATDIDVGTHLPDPVLSLGLLNVPVNTFSFRQEPMTGEAVNLSQTIPYPGSLKAKREVKATDTLILIEEISDRKNKVVKQVTELYYSLQEKRRETELAYENLELLKQISAVTRRKFETGTATLQNIISVEVEMTRTKDKIELLKGEEKSLQSQLNALLLQDENLFIATEPVNAIPELKLNAALLLDSAQKNRPYLKGIRRFEQKSVWQQKEAKYAFYPNFKVGMQYTFRNYNAATGVNYPDFLGIVVGLNIPVNYGKQKTAKINKFKLLQDYYREQYRASLQTLQLSFGKYTADLETLRKREALLAGTLLPQSEKAYEAAMADYQVNKIDFSNVIRAENDILKIKTELVRIRTRYFKTLAQIEFLSGTRLTGN